MTAGSRVLVTGAGGQLGGHAARLLAGQGKEVFATTRRDVKIDAGRPSTVQWLRCDFSKPDEVRAAVKTSRPSWVLHSVGRAGTSDLTALIEANVTSLANLVDALDEVPIECLLVVGSAAEYAASGQREPIREDHPLGPSSQYGISKLQQFALSQNALSRGLPVVYARPFNLIGPGVSCATAVGDISKRLADAVAGRTPGVLEVGDLDRWRDYLDARDAAAACKVLLESAAPGSVYNICSGVPVLMADVVDTLLRLAGGQVSLRRVAGTPSLRFMVGDPSKLRSLGWSPEYAQESSLRDGLQGYIESRRDR
jgi:GDP-4-dehydro-6-deoxy-D-mannose reductase